jgi:hypothetical protein
MRLDPLHFTIELAKNGQIIISIPYTEPEIKLLLGLEQPASAYPAVIQGNSITNAEKR